MKGMGKKLRRCQLDVRKSTRYTLLEHKKFVIL